LAGVGVVLDSQIVYSYLESSAGDRERLALASYLKILKAQEPADDAPIRIMIKLTWRISTPSRPQRFLDAMSCSP
jgi:hypothetical protein